MKITLKIWRQKKADTKGKLVAYDLNNIDPKQSFLETLDTLNQQLIAKGEEPVAFESDCREGICGVCGLYISGTAHGPLRETTTCQLHMRTFKDGETITVEPWRAKPFKVIKDLVVDRSPFDRIIQAGGFVSVNAGNAPDGNIVPISKKAADTAMDAAACIGCGACVAACKNGSAMLFVAAKVAHLAHLPQGSIEGQKRVRAMIAQMDAEGFGSCTNTYECGAVCPKGISVDFIAEMNRRWLGATLFDSK
ncbi:MAG: succinate dehydrogenase/fumarate reductase iron-sulfur subunit [Deltaproteobacteria bacterium]|nr:succinate dehydrogenase/fumarate reductase iron-sulfur subunit [Deltaproteobacteria bacterium]